MARTVRILVQTTTPGGRDDWSVARFSLLTEHLASLQEDGACFEVTARDRPFGSGQDDPVLASLDRSRFDELWLFALDTGDGLSLADCRGITRFRQRGGGILTIRDHQDMGSSLCTLGGVGAAHHFHSCNCEPDPERQAPDDIGTPSISWPNYHSGRNGDFQMVVPVAPVHELLRRPNSSDPIALFPFPPTRGIGRYTARRWKRASCSAGNEPYDPPPLQSGRRFRAVARFRRALSRSRRRPVELSSLRRLQLGD